MLRDLKVMVDPERAWRFAIFSARWTAGAANLFSGIRGGLSGVRTNGSVDQPDRRSAADRARALAGGLVCTNPAPLATAMAAVLMGLCSAGMMLAPSLNRVRRGRIVLFGHAGPGIPRLSASYWS